jgi:methionyl-tRNA formyltransferase
MKYILLTEKSWHINLFNELKGHLEGEWTLINEKSDFTEENVSRIKPNIIFIPHWSYIISPNIFQNYECIVFHMTNLPFGRGGSPLQNLIEMGFKETKISAIKVESKIDSGDVYLKKKLSLDGTAREIFERASFIIKSMIQEIIQKKPTPIPQEGEPFFFKRRTLADSEISKLQELEKIYDFIRMLDCEGYPNAFIETEKFKYEFSNASFNSDDKIVLANVRISKK